MTEHGAVPSASRYRLEESDRRATSAPLFAHEDGVRRKKEK
jgi:hypothetical protein